jgi:type III restriction enzyme
MACELEVRSEVCVYAKLPKRFYINTPIGKYNPDWAIAFNEGMVMFSNETLNIHRSIAC